MPGETVTHGRIKVIYWLTFVIITISLGLGGWNLSATVDQGTRLVCVETRVANGKTQLDKREQRVDKRFDKFERKMEKGFERMSKKLDELIQRGLNSGG